jgi:hypothetical protein
LGWTVTAALIFAGLLSAIRTSSTSSIVSAAVLPAVAMLALFGVLAAKRELARIAGAGAFPGEDRQNLLSFLTGSSASYSENRPWAKKKVWLAAILTAIPCFAVGAVIAALVTESEAFSILLVSRPLFMGFVLGVLGGGLAYLFSCRRLPKVLVEQPIPTYRSIYRKLNLKNLEIDVSLPRERDDDKAAIGPLPRYDETVIPRYSMAARLRLLDLARAMLECALLVAAIFSICTSLVSIGIPLLFGFFLLGWPMLACGLEILSFILLQPSKKTTERWLEYCRRVFPGSRLFFGWVLDSLPGLRAGVVYVAGLAILHVIGMTDTRATDGWLFFVAWAFAVQIRARQFLMHGMSNELRDR